MNYNCTSIVDRIYSYDDVVGSIVHLRNIPINMIGECSKIKNVRYTVKQVYFRIDSLGVMNTLLEFKEIPGKLFSPRGTTFEYVNVFKNLDAVCGKFLVGDALCGHGTSTNLRGSINIIDENGTIISDRYVFIENSDVEDPTTDPDNITNIKVNVDGGLI